MDSIRTTFTPKGYKISLLLILLIQVCKTTYAQVSPNEVKATFILHFCENVSWQDELPKTFKIACFRADDNVYNFLKPAENKIKVQQRTLSVEQISDISKLQGFHAIYYGSDNMDELVKLSKDAKANNTLLITENIDDELFIFININEINNKITFKVNMPNLSVAGLSIKPNLLLNGGSVVDINAAYRKFEDRLENSKLQLAQSEKALAKTKSELLKKETLLKEKEDDLLAHKEDIKLSESRAESLRNTIEQERELLDKQRYELKKSLKLLSNLQKDIEVKETAFVELERNMELLEEKSSKLKSEITDKDNMLSVQEVRLSSQRKMLFMSLALAAAFVLIAIVLYLLFSLKKKNNRLLAQKIDERTKELQLSNQHFQTLFNLAPVALWETDFSDVKQYIASLGLTSENEYDNYVNANDDFSIECVRKVKFLNVNKTALNLYKIESKNEILDIYEGLYKEGKLTSLIPEFKLIFQDQTNHTYESVRKNKQGEEIELIVTWVDISKVPGSFKKVLLSLVDVTHLRKIERELMKHQNELELLVKEKTEELETSNEELIATNEELSIKSTIINDQNAELKATLQHLKETQSQLLQSEKMASLGILTAGVAHEINNPLNYIMGAYEGLKIQHEMSGNDDEQTVLLLEALKTGVDRAANIVKSLSLFSRENQNLNETCDINEILNNTLVMLQSRVKNRIEVVRDYTSEPLTVSGNVGNLHQVFLNLISNAEQAIGEKGKIEIKTRTKNDQIVIEIADTGHGISKENLNKITDPFFTTKDPGKGTGLGLSITYNIIKEHGGELEFESEENSGTCARVVLPLSGRMNG